MLCNAISEKEVENLNLFRYYIETKYDGCRCWYFCKDNKMINRKGDDMRFKFPEIEKIKEDLVLDGEMVCFNMAKSDFNLLSQRIHLNNKFKIELMSAKYPACYMVFDILKKDGKDLTSLPLRDRKQILSESLGKYMGVRLVNETTIEKAKSELQEGVVLKDKMSKYEIGKRSNEWLKFKFVKSKIVLFNTYELNTDDSLTLISKDKNIRVKSCFPFVKEVIDSGEEVKGEVEYLSEYENGKLRFPILRQVF